MYLAIAEYYDFNFVFKKEKKASGKKYFKNFNDIGAKEKAEITRAFKKLHNLHAFYQSGATGQVEFIKPKNKKQLNKIKKSFGIKDKKIKAVPIMTKLVGNNTKTEIEDDYISFKSEYVDKMSFDLPSKRLLKLILTNNKNGIQALIESALGDIAPRSFKMNFKKPRYFSIKFFGGHEQGMYTSTSALASGFLDFISRASLDSAQKLAKNINGFFYTQWKNQKAFKERTMSEKTKARKRAKNKRAKIRAK